MPKTHNDEQKALTMERIEKALFDFMEDCDYERISITSVVEAAGVSRMAFYRNFQSKDDVLRAYLDSLLQSFREEVSDSQELSKHDVALAYFQIMHRNRDALLLLHRVGRDPLLYEQIHEHVRGNLPAVQHKAVAPDAYLAASVCGDLYGITLEWIEGGCAESPEEMAGIFSALSEIRAEAR